MQKLSSGVLVDLTAEEEAEFIAEQKAYEDAKPAQAIAMLKEERNKKLLESDWTQGRDVSLSKDEDWKTYRQKLRDLPATQTPSIEGNNMLGNVTWPTPPE
jgi:purine nucleoside permease